MATGKSFDVVTNSVESENQMTKSWLSLFQVSVWQPQETSALLPPLTNVYKTIINLCKDHAARYIFQNKIYLWFTLLLAHFFIGKGKFLSLDTLSLISFSTTVLLFVFLEKKTQLRNLMICYDTLDVISSRYTCHLTVYHIVVKLN